MNQTIREVTSDIEKEFGFNTAIARIMELVNLIYELKDKIKDKFLVVYTLRKMCLLLGIFVPHIAEESWRLLGGTDTVFKEKWPQYDPQFIEEEWIEYAILINGKVRSRKRFPRNYPEESLRQEVLADSRIKSLLGGKAPKRFIVVKNRIVNIVV